LVIAMDSPDRRRLSRWPRWPSFAVLLLAAAYLTVRWDSIPARWIIHWGARGEPNGWATKTLPGVYGLLALPVVLLVVNEAIAGNRQGRQAVAFDPAMRVATVDFVRIVTFGVTVMTALLAVILPLGPSLPLPALLSLAVAPVVVAFAAGGARLAAAMRRVRAGGGGAKLEGYHALYYANGNDRRLWVPKVTGMGWTINFSHPLAWPMLALLLAVPIAALVLSAAAR
jgi:uncharacterized membrane protein